MAEEEQPLVDPEHVQGPGRRTVIVVTFLIAAAGACGLGFVVSSSAATSHLRATQPWHGAGSEIIQESFTTGSNVNYGNQAGDDVVIKKQTVIQKIYPPPKEEKHPEPCDIVKETDDKVVFGDGHFISYTDPKKFEGGFFDKDYNAITDVKDLPRCLEKLWLVDDQLGGELKDLPRALKNLSLPGRLHQDNEFRGDVQDLPPFLRYLDLRRTSKHITGRVYHLPRGLVHLDLTEASGITGDLISLPDSLRFVAIGSRHVHGRIWLIPNGLTSASFPQATDIDGDVKDLPRGLTYADFREAKLTGQIKDLPPKLTRAYFWHSKKIEGHLSEVPNPKHFKCVREPHGYGGGFHCYCYTGCPDDIDL